VTAPGNLADRYVFDAEDDGPRPDVAAFSIGAYLRTQRRLREMSLEEVESLTRIPQRSLARLEAGAFDRQQDAFARGFVRTVALAIGLDPGDTLVRMCPGESELHHGRAAAPLRLAALGLAGVVLIGSMAAIGLSLAGRIELSGVRSLIARPAAQPVARRDYVREFAEQVRSASPGAFKRPVPLLPPPAMLIAPAEPEVALDAVFPRP
jgi:hypothetical protein